MADGKALVAVLADFDALACASGPGAAPAAGDVAAALLRYAGGVGRVMLARAYADWSERAEDVRTVQAARFQPVLAPRGPGGEDRAHVRLVVDAVQVLYFAGEPDAYVVASADGRLLPLVQALRADGADVLFVAPASAPVDDLRREADAAASLEEVLAGAVGRPSEPRAPAEPDEPPTPVRAERPPPPPPARPAPPWGPRGPHAGRPPYGRPAPRAPAPLDFSNYDWGAFVRLIDELEHRLPFVGVRYLVNKVLGLRNCGVDDPRLKRDLINRAVDDGLLEMYEVGNVGDRSDPVTACRLDRKNAVVAQVLGPDTKTPAVPEQRAPGAEPAGFVEGGLPLDAADDEVLDDDPGDGADAAQDAGEPEDQGEDEGGTQR